MMNDSQTINILLTATDEASKTLQKTKDQIKDFSKKAAIAGGVLTATVTKPLVEMGKQSVDSFSTLQEAVNATNVVFEQSADVIHEFAQTSAQSVGLAESSFLQASTNIGATMINMGLSQEEAAKKTIELTQRAADMASVFDTDVDQALAAISSGLRGQSEPLDRFSVNLLDSQIKAYALAEGIIETDRAMTEEEKTLARMGAIMQQTDKLAGDFANTSGDLANSQKIAQARLEDTRAEIGERLAPIMEKVTDLINQAIDVWDNLNPKLKTVAVTAGILLAVLGPLLLVVSALAMAVATISAPVLAVIAVIAVLILLFVAFKDEIMPIVDQIVAFLKPAFDEMVQVLQDEFIPAMKELWEVIGPVLLPVLKAFGAILLVIVAGPIALIVGAIWVLIKAITLVAKVISTMVKWAISDFKKMVSFFTYGINRIKQMFSGIAGAISNAFSSGMATAKSVVLSSVNWIIDKVNGVIGGINNIASKVGMDSAISPIAHLAMGSENFRGGSAMVGENGPEIVNIPSGSQVLNAQDSAGGLESSFNNYGTINLNSASAVEAFKRELGMDLELANEGIN